MTNCIKLGLCLDALNVTFVQTPASNILNGESFGLQLELIDFFDQRVCFFFFVYGPDFDYSTAG